MNKATSEVLLISDTAFCIIDEINKRDKTDSSGYAGDTDKNARIMPEQNGRGGWTHKQCKKCSTCKMMNSKEGTHVAEKVRISIKKSVKKSKLQNL